MSWKTLGLVFSPPQGDTWMKTHAQVPTPLVCEGFVRVYFSSRPEPCLSQTTFVDLAGDDLRVVNLNVTPILQPGRPGTFDEHGIMPSCAVRNGRQVFLYYSGWSRSSSVPYTNSTGLAISDDDGLTFRKVSEGPILTKSLHDPYSATSPFVMREGEKWHMWYCSGTGWVKVADTYEHTYDIKYARSSDGVVWTPTGHSAVRQTTDLEAITRPWVLKGDGGYHMLFCFRGSQGFRDGDNAYRLGHAFSTDLERWVRDDDSPLASIDRSASGWDARMTAYPATAKVKDKTILFYNGNGFGAQGFGCAALAKE